MSKHIFFSKYADRLVSVQIGWDDPLRHYFMYVIYDGGADENSNRECDIIYSNLSDALVEDGAHDPSYFWNKLDELRIACPQRPQIDRELRIDAVGEGTNRIVRYDNIQSIPRGG